MTLLLGRLPHVILGCLTGEGQTAEQVIAQVTTRRPDANPQSVRSLLTQLCAQQYARAAREPGVPVLTYTLTGAGTHALATARRGQPNRVLHVLGTVQPLTTRELARALNVKAATLSSVLVELRGAGEIRKVPATPRQRHASRCGALIAWALPEAA